jgi:serine/threonine protein phosphatase PrpC
MQLVSYCAKTDKGPYLNINEDDYLIDLNKNIYGIFDGMGGGRVGSDLIRSLKEYLLKFYNQFSDQDATIPFFYSPRFLIEGNALINAIYQSNSLIYEENSQRDNKGASSLVLTNLTGSILTVASIGLGLVYVFRDNRLILLNFSDSLSLSSLIPTNLLGIYESVNLELREAKLRSGDLVLFLSDGIYAFLEEMDVVKILRGGGGLNSKVEQLFEKANNKGNQDNQTALFLQF